MMHYVPNERWKTERFPASAIREGEHFPRLRLEHMREGDGGFMVAQGFDLDQSFPDGCTRVYMVDDDVFTFEGPGTLRCITTGKHWSGLTEPHFLFHYDNEKAENGYYAGGKGKLAYLYPRGTRFLDSRDAYAAAVHHDRLFYIGSDYRLSYTPAIENNSTSNPNKDPQLAGEIVVMQGDGKFVEIASYRDRVYAFRERSLLRLRADAEPLHYKAEILPIPCGAVRRHTAQVIGGKMMLFSENGFYAYDGESFDRVQDSVLEEIDLTAAEGWESTRFAAGYYCIVPRKDGEKGFFYYDTERRRACFLNYPATSVAAGTFVSFAANAKYSYRLTDCGLGFGHAPSRIVLTVAAKRRGLDGITVRGAGTFTLSVGSGEDVREFEGTAEKPIRFPVPVRTGTAELTISVNDLTFRLAQLELHWREYDD